MEDAELRCAAAQQHAVRLGLLRRKTLCLRRRATPVLGAGEHERGQALHLLEARSHLRGARPLRAAHLRHTVLLTDGRASWGVDWDALLRAAES